MTTFTDDTAAQRKEKKKQRTEFDHAEANKQKAVQELFKTPEGRTYLWWLLELCRVPAHTPYRKTDRDTAFTCGEQNVGLQIMAHMIHSNPEGYAQLMMEKMKDDRRNDNTSSGNDSDESSDGDEDRGDNTSTGEYT